MNTPAVRRPAVAGRFYPARPEALIQEVDQYLAEDGSKPTIFDAPLGCMVPHAGYRYSGPVAGAVFQRLPARASYIILCPNHTGRGAPLSIASEGEWQTPLGSVGIDHDLAASLRQSCALLKENSEAHEDEHAIEVELPFLQRSVESFAFVPIVIAGQIRYDALVDLGRAIVRAIRQAAGSVLVVASSDMNHFESDEVTRIKDHKAIGQMLALDPEGLFDVTEKEEISMCGRGPAVAMMTAAKALGATRSELIRYATSGDAPDGDRSSVVGYAGMVIS